jgi:hypothetical protein
VPILTTADIRKWTGLFEYSHCGAFSGSWGGAHHIVLLRCHVDGTRGDAGHAEDQAKDKQSYADMCLVPWQLP